MAMLTILVAAGLTLARSTTDRSIIVRQILRSHFDGFIASFRTSAEDGDVTASDTALPLPRVGER